MKAIEEIKLTKKERAVMDEAFMVGRIYNKMGEKELPAEIYKKLEKNCINAIKRLK